MDEKEKAKAYDEALKRARAILKVADNRQESFDYVSTIFPELLESEDEKIRKDLIEWFEEFPDMIWRGHCKKDILAWLEKQKDTNVLIQEASEKAYTEGMRVERKHWLEKQDDNLVKNGYTDNKDFIKYADNYSHEIWHKLMDNFKNIKDYYIGCNDVSDIVLNAIIDTCNWLEKQGEKKSIDDSTAQEAMNIAVAKCFDKQKPADNVETKFKVGNWYQCTKDFFGKGVTFDKNTAYYCAKEGCLQNEYGCHIAIVKDLYDNFKLWTIADAKDGDVLYSKEHNLLWLHKDSEQCHSCINLNYSNNISIGTDIVIPKDAYPATKEQRDTLEKAMADAGYIFDFENKELKKIEKKTAWSDEEEEELGIAVQYLQKAGQFDSVNWLKSLKTRTGG